MITRFSTALFLIMKLLITFISLMISTSAFAQEQVQILSMQDRAATIDRLLEDKLKNTLPALMRREGLDMWIVMSREYNEDPIIKTLLPATWLAARRRTILLMYDPGPGHEIETLAVARYDVGTVFKRAWEPDQQPDQWLRLVEIIKARDPQKIGLNTSDHWGLADGMAATDLRQFTINLDITFLDAAMGSHFEAHGRIVRVSKSTAFAEGDFVDANGKVCATAKGIWRVFWPRNKIVAAR